MAEWGSPSALEAELRVKGPRLRTLIKAAGLWYPNVNLNTSSQFRVDRKHHKVSLVSMFGMIILFYEFKIKDTNNKFFSLQALHQTGLLV